MTPAMLSGASARRPGPFAWIAAALLIVALPIFAAWISPYPARPSAGNHHRSIARREIPPPPVEPVAFRDMTPETARMANAAVPFSTAPNPAAKPFRFAGDLPSLARATDCLAAAMLYEAGDEPIGERAVGQVVLNRLRHPAFPKTVCEVVFEGSERATGCQFTFTCDGAMARLPAPAAWQRARKLASAMLDGGVFRPVGYSTHYHTDWVVPYWSSSLEKVTAIDTHLFFRWQGWWGTPSAFLRRVKGEEPRIAALAAISPEHVSTEAPVATAVAGVALPSVSLIDDTKKPLTIEAAQIGGRVAGVRLLAVTPEGESHAVLLDRAAGPSGFEEIARTYCAGRPRCRLLGWISADSAPRAFPLTEANIAAMAYAYLRTKDAGIERSLYNCTKIPNAPLGQCMRGRSAEPAAAPPGPARETIILRTVPQPAGQAVAAPPALPAKP
ncbi:cell wall hydrolase [Sphingobium sp. CR28]|uniref:cell wall hydrolase n=1 Tax=Sphingobium sp. CR28 TaxID=3400272 RepID=UPI003FEED08D